MPAWGPAWQDLSSWPQTPPNAPPPPVCYVPGPLPLSHLQGAGRGWVWAYQAEEVVFLLWVEVQTGEGQQHVTQVRQGDALGSAQDVLGHGAAG